MQGATRARWSQSTVGLLHTRYLRQLRRDSRCPVVEPWVGLTMYWMTAEQELTVTVMLVSFQIFCRAVLDFEPTSAAQNNLWMLVLEDRLNPRQEQNTNDFEIRR